MIIRYTLWPVEINFDYRKKYNCFHLLFHLPCFLYFREHRASLDVLVYLGTKVLKETMERMGRRGVKERVGLLEPLERQELQGKWDPRYAVNGEWKVFCS